MKNKKLLIIIIAAVLLIAAAITIPLLLINKDCAHTYDNACDATCNNCGAEREVVHRWEGATCTTPGICSVCGATADEPAGHTPDTDDGDCTTAQLCTSCGTVLAEGRSQHIAGADDGDCSTAVTCKECSYIFVKASTHSLGFDSDKNGHRSVCKNDGCSFASEMTAHTEGSNGICTECGFIVTVPADHKHSYIVLKSDASGHWFTCMCGDAKPAEAHTEEADDRDCTTAGKCTVCAYVITPSADHKPGEDDGNCTTDILCTLCGKTAQAGAKAHTVPADDKDCTTAVSCTVCKTVVTAAKPHSYTGSWQSDKDGHWRTCQNGGCATSEAKAAHTEGTDGVCTVCGFIVTVPENHKHEYSVQKSDASGHWMECLCGDKQTVQAHTGKDDNNCTTALICTECGYEIKAAASHMAEEDDGNCTTGRKCKNCDQIAIPATHTEHNDTDGDYECDNGGCMVILPGAPEDDEPGIDLPIVWN